MGLADKLQDEVTETKNNVFGVEIPRESSPGQSSGEQSGFQPGQPTRSSDQPPSQSKRKRHRRRKNKQQTTQQQEVQSTELWPENTPVKIEDE